MSIGNRHYKIGPDAGEKALNALRSLMRAIDSYNNSLENYPAGDDKIIRAYSRYANARKKARAIIKK